MERSSIITLILLSIPTYDLRFASGIWIEIEGCHLLNGSLATQREITMNEPGECLTTCGTNTVALKDLKCFCVKDVLAPAYEAQCNRHCSGSQRLQCGGDAGGFVSVYNVRQDVHEEWSKNGSGCLTYNPAVNTFNPENCSVAHYFYCYSELHNPQEQCYRDYQNIKKSWFDAVDYCWSQGYQHLWPANDIKNCSMPHDLIPRGEKAWVAVYHWTKEPTTSSTVPPTTSSAVSPTLTSSTASPITPTTVSSTSTSTNTSPITTSTISSNFTSTTASPTTTTTISPNFTSVTSSLTTTATASTTSPSTTTSTTVITTYSASTSASFTEPPTTFTTISTTHVSSRSTLSILEPLTFTGNINPSGTEANSFKFNASSVGIGVGIGLIAGSLISIAVVYCRMKKKKSYDRRESSRNTNQLSAFYLGSNKLKKNIYLPAPIKDEENANRNTHSNNTGAYDNATYIETEKL